MLPHYQHLATVAAECALLGQNPRPFGAYVRSKFFSGGFGFTSLEGAAEWVEQQRMRAEKDGARSDFQAAISAYGQCVALFS